MKKMFKKSIACLIAVLMVVSTMPFTALANGYDDFDTMKSNMASYTAYSPSAIGSFTGDDTLSNYSDHYKGLVYSQTVSTYTATGSKQLGSDFWGSNTCYANLYFPQAVALYTGSNEITVPVMISASVSRSGTWNCKFRPQAGIISGTGMSLAMNKWGGKDSVKGPSDNCYANGNQTTNIPKLNFIWTVAQTGYVLSTDKTTGTNTDIDPGYARNAQLFANKVKVTPSFSSTATSVTTADYKPTITLYVSSSGKGFEDKSIELASTNAVTVVNYKVYLDKLAQAKTDVAALNAAEYTEGSVANYVAACNKLLAINPTSYDYASNTASAVSSLVADMNDAISTYDTAKAGLHKHVMSEWAVETAGTCTTKAVEERHCTADNCDDVNKAKETREGSFSAHVRGEVKDLNDETKHYVYCDVCKEYMNSEAHTYTVWTSNGNGTHTATCDNCTRTKTEDCDKTTGECPTCGEVFVDFTAYDAALAAVKTNDDNEYTEKSFEKYTDAVEAAKIDKATATQADVDAAVTAIEEAEALLVINNVTITFVVYDEDGEEVKKEDTIDAVYGQSVPLDAEGTVKKWIISDGDIETNLQRADSKIDLLATKNQTVKAFLKDEDQKDSAKEYAKINFYGKNGVLFDVKYIEKTVYSTDVVIAQTGVIAPTVAFYTPYSWTLNAIRYGETDEVDMYANYKAKEDTARCTIHFGDQERSYAYDSFVYLKSWAAWDASANLALSTTDDETGLLTYINEKGEFYAPHAADIYVIEVATKADSTAITGSYSLADKGMGTGAVFNAKFYANDMSKVQEFGIVVINPNTGAEKVIKADSASENNEYSVKVNLSATTSLTSLQAKSYVVIDGETIYSPVATQAL